ncbi:hypothetical protein [Acinetobacter guillouiae]|uniref:hypothetical protein n=1 Tax=Acinetobacter guillouiae TaxID=106649 RepID=UPI00333ECF6F
MDISVKDLNKKIEDFKENKEPQSLIVGYKTYSKLMKEDKFSDKLIKDSNDPMIIFYRNLKINIVTEKHYFEIQ